MTPFQIREICSRLQAMEEKMGLLLEAIESGGMSKKLKEKGLHLRISVGNAATAQRARVGRVASRHGMSFQEWVERFGMVERLPGPEAQETLPDVEQ